jgi:hypothetical protein
MQHCDDAHSQTLSNTTTALIIAAGMLVAFVVPLLIYVRLKRMRKQQMYQTYVNRQLRVAMGTTRRLDCPAAYIRADTFCKLGQLRSHEELRDEGKLIFKDRVEQLSDDDQFVVFISHQWISSTEPDPTGVQYPVMVAAVKRVARAIIDGDFMHARFLKKVASDASVENDAQLWAVLEKMVVWVEYADALKTCPHPQPALPSLLTAI